MKNTLLCFTILLLTISLPKIHFGQAPALGRASSFTLFTSSGAFTNSGASIITGDIGTNGGALTGFPPGSLVGSIHIADSVTALAATNLGTAYASLTTLTCDSTIGSAMGNGQILTPKVYCITTLATINGNLTLNALGNPNAVFVIKVNGALSTGISTKILLINSANFNNVYWQVNGAFTLGDSSIFRGTLIANGAINLLPKSSILGRGLTTAGAITIQNTNNTLPVKLISFGATCNGKNIFFKWATASEINNHYFTLESSSDQHKWESISKIKGAGTSNSVNTYSYLFLDRLSTNSYYRLKQTDIDGHFSYSNIVAFSQCNDEAIAIELYPNPATGIVSLSSQNVNQSGSVSVYDMIGMKVYHSEEFPSTIDLSAQPNGIYFLHFTNGHQNQIKKIMIKHL
jgi:Ice-binding-like/Secretion system C-terminal sorting domain